jgi:outer membrane protein with beta-barrel domain
MWREMRTFMNILINRTVHTVVFYSVIALIAARALYAQDYEPGPDNKLNSNLAFITSAPLNPTAKYATVGWGFTYGAGYNFTRRHSVIAEVMWNRLYATSQVLAPIRAALQTTNVNGHGNLVTLSANYRLQFQGKVFGTYLIGGGGMLYRNASLSQQVTVGNFVSCTPAWLWWGFACTSGTVTSNQTLRRSSSTAPAVNGGIGFSVKLPDSWYKFYVETRYYYAPNKSVSTQVIPITIGIRF